MATPLTSLDRMRAVARTRWRLAGALTATMMAVYFGFLSLVAWAPQALGRRLVPGLSLGVLLGALVIVAAWLLTWVYVRWANAVYDPMVAEQRREYDEAKRAAAGRRA
jgi:uncharacterized membrane protein (DUF485 family)